MLLAVGIGVQDDVGVPVTLGVALGVPDCVSDTVLDALLVDDAVVVTVGV